MNIPLIKPYIDSAIKEKVLEVLDSGYLTEGSVTHLFEDEFSKYIGCEHSIAVTSCTTGLEIALRALNIGTGDEVIVPDYTYPATASVISIVGARPVIVDIDRETMLIDSERIEAAITKRTKAIIPVSLFGNPLDYEKINRIKDKYNIYIVEDAACAVGAEYKGKKAGNWADISVFSFHPRKFITTGEGGMVTTNNEKWAEWMNSYKHFGMSMNNLQRESVHFEKAGTNYKLSNLLAAIGLAQLEKIDVLLKRRREMADNYLDLLKSIEGVSIPKTTEKGKHSYQSFCIFIKNRDAIMKSMRSNGIEVQIGTYSLHMHKAFQNRKVVTLHGNFENSIYAFNHCVTLPLYHELRFEEQELIVEQLRSLMTS
jgi:dTDP-4-amino-4,6-dideoxygalactose transaminase